MHWEVIKEARHSTALQRHISAWRQASFRLRFQTISLISKDRTLQNGCSIKQPPNVWLEDWNKTGDDILVISKHKRKFSDDYALQELPWFPGKMGSSFRWEKHVAIVHLEWATLMLFSMHMWIAAKVFHHSVPANLPSSWDCDQKMPPPRENHFFFSGKTWISTN